MTVHRLTGPLGSDPLGLLAVLGLLRVISRVDPEVRVHWALQGEWRAALSLRDDVDPIDAVVAETQQWRKGCAALDFARDADRKIQDLKHPPARFRELMREVRLDRESADFVAAYGTGVAVDGTGQNKPTSFHFTAGQQRFMDNVIKVVDGVAREDIAEALYGPWRGRSDLADTRWRAGSERNRALLSYDPGPDKALVPVGAVFLAFLALPLFPVVPVALRAVTTGFRGRGKSESFVWPLWTVPLTVDAARTLLASPALESKDTSWRAARGVGQVFESAVLRSAQGYGNFGAPEPR